MNNKIKNIRARLKINSSENRGSNPDLTELLKDKDLVGDDPITYITFESNSKTINEDKENHLDKNLKLSELEEAYVENKDQFNKLIEKTNYFLKNSKQQIVIKDANTMSNSTDRKPLETSKISTNSERAPVVLVYPEPKFIDEEEKPYDNTKFNKIVSSSFNNTLNNNFITDNSLLVNNIDESFKSNYSNGNIQYNNTINNRLLEKIKSIKKLENELKEKNSIIDKLNLKIEKQRIEIQTLRENQSTDDEQSKIKKELEHFKNCLNQKELENTDLLLRLQELINQYQEKMTKFFNDQNILINKVKGLDFQVSTFKLQNNNLIQELNTLENVKESLESQMKNLKENFEDTLKEKQKIHERLNSLIDCVKILVNLIMNTKDSFNSLNDKCFKIFNKVKDLMTEEINNESNEI